MRYRIIIGNFYNIQHMTFFCAISDVSDVHVTMHFEGNKYIFVPFSTGFQVLPSIL